MERVSKLGRGCCIASLGFGRVVTLIDVVLVACHGGGHCGSGSEICFFQSRVCFCNRRGHGRSRGQRGASLRSGNSFDKTNIRYSSSFTPLESFGTSEQAGERLFHCYVRVWKSCNFD